jgi:hypothetical protein
LEGAWKFTTNAPHFQNPYLDKSEWSSFSVSTKEPYDTFRSALAALGAHDENALNQLVLSKDSTQSPYDTVLPPAFWDKVSGIQVVDISTWGVSSSSKVASIGTIIEKQVERSGDGIQFENPALQRQRNTIQSLRTWYLVQTNGQWLITGYN